MFDAAPPLPLDANQRQRPEFLVPAGNTPQKLVQRARIVLLAAAGRPNAVMARELDVSRPTVLLWRARFAHGGVPGLSYERPRPGRKPAIGPEKIQAVVEATLQTTPPPPPSGACERWRRRRGSAARPFTGFGGSRFVEKLRE